MNLRALLLEHEGPSLHTRPTLPLGPHATHARTDLTSRPARRRAVSLLGILLAALVLLAPLSACAPTTAVGDTEVADEAHPEEPTSQAPADSPTPEQTTEAATTAPPTASPTAEETTPAEAPVPVPTEQAADGTALAMLAGLEEKGRAPKTGYDRDSFGWRNDIDRNGCDTRIISSSLGL